MKKVAVTISIVFLLLAVAYFFFKPRYLPPVHIISSLPGTYAKKLLSGGNAYLITDVAVIPMNQDTVLTHQNVVINHGRIVTITGLSEPIDSASAPVLIDGTGKFLIPGLSDMHVHINDDTNLLLLVANGVTTVRNMAGYPFHLQLREQIKQQTMLGPTLYTASPILEGENKIWPFSIALKTKQDAANAVRRYKHEGYDFIKIYHTLPEDVYREVLRVGDSIQISVVGHIPFQVDLNAVLSSSQYSLEHVDVSPISPHIPLLKRLELIGQSGKWLCPTLVVYRNRQRNPIAPAQQTNYEQYVDGNTIKFWKQHAHYESRDEYTLQQNMTKLIFDKGGKFLTGTDCLNSYVLAGFSLHEELAELVDAGIPAYDVLKASTVNAAEFLKRGVEVGTVEPGKIADLVLLKGNPLSDITNTKKIEGVMVRGHWLGVDQIAAMLNDVKRFHQK